MTVEKDVIKEGHEQPLKGNKDKTYTLLENEQELVHATIQKKGFNPSTGKPMYRPQIYKADPRMWRKFLQHPNGFEVKKIHHLPEGTPATLKDAEKKGKK